MRKLEILALFVSMLLGSGPILAKGLCSELMLLQGSHTLPLAVNLEKVKELENRFPENIKLVNQVKISVNGGKETTSGVKDVLVISTASLSDADRDQMRNTYLDLFGPTAISVWTAENGPHNWVRVGETSFDRGDNRLNESPFRLPNSKGRLELVLDLTQSEHERMLTYIANIRASFQSVLGGQGGPRPIDSDTGRTLENNRPVKEGSCHNCVSWYSTAPIGAEGKTLFEIMGLQQKDNTHILSGAWTSHILTQVSLNRNPLVVYWTTRPLAEPLETLNGDNFIWNIVTHLNIIKDRRGDPIPGGVYFDYSLEKVGVP